MADRNSWQLALVDHSYPTEWNIEQLKEFECASQAHDSTLDRLLDTTSGEDAAKKIPAKCSFPGCRSGMRFTRLCDFRKHLKQHHRTFLCRHEGCSKSRPASHSRSPLQPGWFATTKDRNRHEAKHNPGVACLGLNPDGTRCRRLFSRKDNMVTHMKKTHGTVSSERENSTSSSGADEALFWNGGFDELETSEFSSQSIWCSLQEGSINNFEPDDERMTDNVTGLGGLDVTGFGERASNSHWTGIGTRLHDSHAAEQNLEHNQPDFERTCYVDTSIYIEWLKGKTTLDHKKLAAALPRLEEAAVVLEQLPDLTKDDLLGIGLPLGIVVALQHNYERFRSELFF